jgi:flavin-dependent dehydrogenase
MLDVIIAGGGPAGLAAAIRSAARGFRTVVLDRAVHPDKACGEGLMPSGTAELAKLGARIPEACCTPFRGIRYLQEDETVLEARFGERQGLGIRRTALIAALRQRALESGARIEQRSVLGCEALDDVISVRTDEGTLEARLLIAADGLQSPLRRAAGLTADGSGSLRFGLRRHFSLRPWTDFVEVYWADGLEAYVTPVAADIVNVAFLRDREGDGDFAGMMDRFPRLRERVGAAAFASELRGAGPLLQRVRARWAPRLALIGDAAGYVDAITGQGLSLAFAASAILLDTLPSDLSGDLSDALRRYDRKLRARWLSYAVPASALVALSRRPALRRAAFRAVAKVPFAFAGIVRAVGG